MESQEHAKTAIMQRVQVPEWEHIAAQGGSKESGIPRKAPRITLQKRFDTVMPPHRKYLGMSRKIFLGVLLALLLVAVVLIVSLMAGLRRTKHQDLPLPSNAGSFTGDLTYFDPGLGACGMYSTSADKIVSLSHFLFDAAGSSSSDGGNSNNNPLCGRMIRARRFNEAVSEMRSVDLKVVDRCTGCQPDDLDTTESAFEQLAAIADGRVTVTWAWL